MNRHGHSLYTPYLDSDNALCVPVLTSEQITALLLRTEQIAVAIDGEGDKPSVSLDLEHLQVADYSAFPPITQDQQDAIRRLQAVQPIRSDEMAFLALRSMIGLWWERPSSDDAIRRAASYDKALEMALTELSPLIGRRLGQHNAPLPYWGRLGFLRVMTTIPDEHIQTLGLQHVACVLLKDAAFNARSYHFDTFGLVGLNFALEPILKSLNRMLLHFFHTQSMAGPRRMERAWCSLAPIVSYFWAPQSIAANQLSPFHLLFDEAMQHTAQALTASQIDFIIRHELGHLVFDHARRIRTVSNESDAKVVLRHEFEFAADAFAQNSMRSVVYSRLRAELQAVQQASSAVELNGQVLDTLRDHQAEVTGVRLLFAYMDAIDSAGQLLKRRLGNAIAFRSEMDSHPSPSARLARLNALHIGEHPPTSQLLRYAESFFAEVLAYADGLDGTRLAASLPVAS